jgi:RNA exonuclease 1
LKGLSEILLAREKQVLVSNSPRDMGSKKRRHHHREAQSDRNTQPLKKRRLSEDGELDADNTLVTVDKSAATNHNGRTDEEGWTRVEAKSSKRSKAQSNNEDYYPTLRINQNYRSDTKLKDLRDLGLYLLADEAAPRFCAVANSRLVSKVVAIMVPGLDEKLLRRVEKLYASSDDPAQPTNGHEGAVEFIDSSTNGIKTSIARDLVAQAQPNSDQPLSWLFTNVLQVKAPGDTKMSKVHSPLQAMLLSQSSDKSQQRNSNVHVAERTPIASFVHSTDELREAEFPIHPALFTSQLDAELEATRREKTGQSATNGWVDSAIEESKPEVDPSHEDAVSQGLTIYSVDCEMVQTSDDVISLARVSIISYPDGKVVMDKYVKPDLPITNYFTQFSGITPELLENVTTTLRDVQEEILKLLTPSTVLIGHSLDSDLNALKMTHPFLIDTSIIYPHPRGLPLRSSLKYLTNKYLKREIQNAGANGHNSVEDAQVVLDLVKLKCEKGAKWGTIEANGEPIFRRLQRNGRTSAMIEYGTPERGYGKEATYSIGCQNDDDIVTGVLRGIKGDAYFDFEIPAGGVDFVWGRLRALEFARGWVSGGSLSAHNTKKDSTAEDGEFEEDDETKLVELARQTLDRVQQTYEALPPKSLLMVCSGTSDVRPVMQLQAQQAQYRKEFKVKKWDELSVKWTDTEEQALKRACEADAVLEADLVV